MERHIKIKDITVFKILILILVWISSAPTYGQKLNRMGNGLPYADDDRNANTGFHTQINTYNNKIYYPIFWKTTDSNTYKAFLAIWDGGQWSYSDSFTLIDTVHTHQVFNNQFSHYEIGFNKDTVIFAYTTYVVDSLNKITASLANVKKYDGVSWTQIGNKPFILRINHTNSLDESICSIVTWRDTLRIIGGIPTPSLGKVLKWMSKLVNGNWEEDHSLDMASNQGFRADLSKVIVNNDSLWITLKYRDSVWCFVGNSFIGYKINFFGGLFNEYKLAIKNSEIYLLGYMSNFYNYKLFKLKNNLFELINTGVSIPGYGWQYSINVVNDLIVVSPINGYGNYFVEKVGKYSVFSSNLKTNVFSSLWSYSDGKNMYFSGELLNISPNHIASSSLNKGILTGKTYNDKNKNSVLDSGENIIPYAIVYDPDPLYKNIVTISDSKGVYSLFLDFNLPITLRARKGKHTIETNTQYDTIDVEGTKYHNIPMSTPVIKDLEIKILSKNLSCARKADTIQYTIMVRNNGVNANNIVVAVSFDSLMDTVDMGVFLYNNGMASLIIDSIKADEVKEYTFRLWANTQYQLGNYNYITASLQQSDFDNDSSDNFDTLRQKVVSAYDPNEKQSYPSGQTSKPVTEITYQINFQNEGDDYARNVIISDTLDKQLPAYEITLNNASHPYKLSIDGNILYFTFENINLLPKKDNQQASKGHINFSAKLRRDMSVGETIANKAHIFFDYEKPVLTNTASINRVSKIDTTTGIPIISNSFTVSNSFIVYPNPTNGNLVINNTTMSSQTMCIYSIDGKMVHSFLIYGFNTKTIDMTAFSSGIYFIKNDIGEHIRLLYNK